jgi:uncharacterized phiE125 gp8 family phage protein
MLAFDAIALNAVAMGSGSAQSSSVSADLAIAYPVRGAVASDLSASYAIRAAVFADLAVQYGTSGRVDADLQVDYSVGTVVMSPVSAVLAVAYSVCSEVSSDLSFLFSVEESADYVRAPLGTVCRTGAAAYPDTLKRLGAAEAAVSLDAARRAARVDGDELDDEVLTAAIAYTEAAEHATSRAFVQQTWRAGFSAFSAEMILPKPPLISIAHVAFYDEDGVRRTLDPQDYFVDADAEPAVLRPAPGRIWPATLDRAGAVEVQYSCGYGPTEASVPKPIKQYVLARVQQQFSPVSTAKDDAFDRLLDQFWVYA